MTGRSAAEIDKQIRRSTGWKLQLALNRIRASQYAFKKNHHDLHLCLTRLEPQGICQQDFISLCRSALDGGMWEVNRMALNYLSTAVALQHHIDQQLRHNNELKFLPGLEVVKNAYYKARDTGAEAGLLWFIVGLRNYSLHHALPLVTTKGTCQSDGSMAVEIELDVRRLREREEDWPKSRPGREHLHAMSDHENAAMLVARHEQALTRLCDTLLEKLQTAFAAELAETESLLQAPLGPVNDRASPSTADG